MPVFDFKITDDGELEVTDGINSLNMASGAVLLRQQVINRIKSVTNDWFNTTIGANIEELLGKTNNQEAAINISSKITESLSDILNPSNVFVIPKVNKDTLEFALFIKNIYSTTPIVINVEIDILSGVTIKDDINT